MRGLQIPLNQTQKVRLQRALEKLESSSSKVNFNASVTVADSIPVNYEDGILKYLSLSQMILTFKVKAFFFTLCDRIYGYTLFD